MEEKGFNVKVVFGTIVGVSVLLIVVAMVFQALDIGMDYTETFDVNDASVDQHVNLTNNPDTSTITVDQWTGVAWVNVPAASLTINGGYIIVDDGALFG